jgi:GNAT superfamily N-acetyltransferase
VPYQEDQRSIRLLNHDEARHDHDRLAGLLHAALAGPLGASGRDLDREVDAALLAAERHPAGTALAAELGRELVGVLVATAEPEQHRVFLRWVATHPDHRRQGVATSLLDQLQLLHPYSQLYGGVDQQDPVALAFWHQRGWTRLHPPPRRVLMGASPLQDAP